MVTLVPGKRCKESLGVLLQGANGVHMDISIGVRVCCVTCSGCFLGPHARGALLTVQHLAHDALPVKFTQPSVFATGCPVEMCTQATAVPAPLCSSLDRIGPTQCVCPGPLAPPSACTTCDATPPPEPPSRCIHRRHVPFSRVHHCLSCYMRMTMIITHTSIM